MGKRIRQKAKSQPPQDPKATVREHYSVKAIQSHQDLEQDEVDIFHAQRGKVDFEGSYEQEEEQGDEEVYALNVKDSDDESESSEEQSESGGESEEESGSGADEWGDRAGNYYDGDEGEEEDDAKLEEEEARRLQKKHALAMNEEDFLDHLPGQLSGKAIVKDASEDKKLVDDLDAQLKMIEIEQDIEVLPKSKQSLSPAAALAALGKESQITLMFLDEIKERWDYVVEKMPSVTSRIQALKPETVRSTPILKHIFLKYETLLNYMTNMAFYLHLKASGTKDIETHPVVEALEKYSNILLRLEAAEEGADDIFDSVDQVLTRIENGGNAYSSDDDSDLQDGHAKELPEILDQGSESEGSAMETETDDESEDLASVADEESSPESQDNYTSLEQLRRNLKTSKAHRARKDSDFMDSEFLDEDDATEKMAKKRTLRHHASVINQAIFKRQTQPKFSGDADIPYKNADAQRNKRPASHAINQESNDADVFDDDEEVPKIVESKKKRVRTLDPEEMERRRENWVALNPDEQEVDENRKRLATYKILKNKGLAPKRKKEQRNPRVKHRMKFEKASKKLSSFKRVVQKPTSSYGGEATGIKTHLSRSVRFQ